MTAPFSTDDNGFALSREAIDTFICNGFLQLQCGLEEEKNHAIDQALRGAIEQEFQSGNNILPRVPELYEVLESPVVHGALSSLLGAGYMLHPHRFVHVSTPIEDRSLEIDALADAPVMGPGSMAGSGWHQDAHSPLARARYHTPRHVTLFYFPHDTPALMGPTRLQPGSQYYPAPVDDRYRLMPDFIAAGTVILAHFDIVHAGFTNRGDSARYMVKFVFSRTHEPELAPPGAQHEYWTTPADNLVDEPLEATWSAIHAWLQGFSLPAHEMSPQLGPMMELLDAESQRDRLEAIYQLARLGEAAVPALLAKLSEAAGQGREQRALLRGKDGQEKPVDRPVPERRWNERAVVMEDAAYALARMGDCARQAAVELSCHDDPWMQINAGFVLGEIGGDEAVDALVRQLQSPHHQVVRQALDALSCVRDQINVALPAIENLLTRQVPDWQAGEVLRGWSAQMQIHVNAVFALVCAIQRPGSDKQAIERLLVGALDNRHGYVQQIAMEGLSRIDSASALRAALAHAKKHHWDASLAGIRIY